MYKGPKDLPLLFSKTGFSDALPDGIMNFFHKKALVSLLEINDGIHIGRTDKNIKPSRSIAVEFDGHPQDLRLYTLIETKIKIINEEERLVRFMNTIPDYPPTMTEFEAWVNQSINQAAISIFNNIKKEIALSTQLEATFLTQSDLVNELFKLSTKIKNDIPSYTLNTILNMELPIVTNINFEDILKVRYEDGEAFERFRIYLEKQFKDLRIITDEDQLKTKIDNIMHELHEVQVNKVNMKVKNLLKKLFINSSLLGLGLVGTFFTSGIRLYPTLIALASGYKNYNEYISQVKENPAYLLWKVKKKARL